MDLFKLIGEYFTDPDNFWFLVVVAIFAFIGCLMFWVAVEEMRK